MTPGNRPEATGTTTSIDKALDVCEALSSSQRGMTLTDLARGVGLPRPSVTPVEVKTRLGRQIGADQGHAGEKHAAA